MNLPRNADSTSQDATPYTDAVRSYAEQPYVRVDVPGHSGDEHRVPELADLLGEHILRLDVPPLVDGIDQGESPTPLQASAALAAKAWGAHRTWLLTNGASKGNLVTCLALRHLGRDVIAQRSMHSSVMDGMVLGGLHGHFVEPDVDTGLGAAHGLTPAMLEAAFAQHPGAVAAYVITPSYFGAVADVRGLADVAHAHGALLVVDEAWGAHFGFHPDLPTNAARLGADLVISSTHKLGGSLTQSAMLHLGHGDFVDRLEPAVNRAFRSMQSTSSSSLLMMSLDVARHALAVHGRKRITGSLEAVASLREGIRAGGRFAELSDRFLASPSVVAVDPLRVVIDTRVGGISGHAARQLLFEQHQVKTEMSTDSTVVCVVGAGAVPDVARILAAFEALPDLGDAASLSIELPPAGPRAMSLREAYFSPSELVPTAQAVGRISADSLAAYPPGIPNVLPGEVLTTEVLDYLQHTADAPFGHVRGAVDQSLSLVRVVSI